MIRGTVARANDRRKRRIIPLRSRISGRERKIGVPWTYTSRKSASPSPLLPLYPSRRRRRRSPEASSCERRGAARMGTKNYYIFAVCCTSDEAATALSHAIVQKWTPNNWRQASVRAGNHRAASLSNYREMHLFWEKYSRYFLDKRAYQEVLCI